MKIGSLYQNKKYCWLVYPSKDIAQTIAADMPLLSDSAMMYASAAARWASFCSNKLNCTVSFISPSTVFVLLEQDGGYCKILSANGELSWIIYPESKEWKDDIEEVNQ